MNGSSNILSISQINVLLTVFFLAHISLIASCNSRLGFYLVVLLMMPQPRHCSGRIIKNQPFLLLQKKSRDCAPFLNMVVISGGWELEQTSDRMDNAMSLFSSKISTISHLIDF